MQQTASLTSAEKATVRWSTVMSLRLPHCAHSSKASADYQMLCRSCNSRKGPRAGWAPWLMAVPVSPAN
jgi:hypothetical protein